MHAIRSRTIAAALTAAALSASAATAVAHDPGHGGGPSGDQHGQKTPARPGTKLSIRVVKDRFNGWNLLIRTRGFKWAPERASTAHRAGEGHAHLEIDGKPVTRIYGAGYFIAKLKPGRRTVRVALATNAHAEYVDGRGRAIADRVTVRVPKGSK